MSNVIIGVIGVVLFIVLATASAIFLGQQFTDMHNAGMAAAVVSQAGQIDNAISLYTQQNGQLPDVSQPSVVLTNLVATGFLKSVPNAGGGNWAMGSSGESRSVIGPGANAAKVCIAARRQMSMPNPGTPLACTNPALTDSDPCCTQ